MRQQYIQEAGAWLRELRLGKMSSEECEARLILTAIKSQRTDDHKIIQEYFHEAFEKFRKLKSEGDEADYLISEGSSGSVLRWFDDEPEEVEYFANFRIEKVSYEQVGIEAISVEQVKQKAYQEARDREVESVDEDETWTLESIEGPDGKEVWNKYSEQRRSRKPRN